MISAVSFTVGVHYVGEVRRLFYESFELGVGRLGHWFASRVEMPNGMHA